MEAMTRELTLESGQCSMTSQQIVNRVLGPGTKGRERLQGRVPLEPRTRVSADENDTVIEARLDEMMRDLDRRDEERTREFEEWQRDLDRRDEERTRKYEERQRDLDRRDEERTRELAHMRAQIDQLMQFFQNQQGPGPPSSTTN